MRTIVTITGEAVEVCPEPISEAPKRMSRQAVFLGGVRRGYNVFGDELIDRYFLTRMRAKRYWVMWVCFVDHSDYEGRVVRVPLKWCLTKGLGGKATASAMLQAAWQGNDLFSDWERVSKDTTVWRPGLLSASEIAEVLRRAPAAKA